MWIPSDEGKSTFSYKIIILLAMFINIYKYRFSNWWIFPWIVQVWFPWLEHSRYKSSNNGFWCLENKRCDKYCLLEEEKFRFNAKKMNDEIFASHWNILLTLSNVHNYTLISEQKMGIHLLAFSPNMKLRLEPLDVSVNSAFKARFSQNKIIGMFKIPEKNNFYISIYNFVEVINKFFVESGFPKNITSGFC